MKNLTPFRVTASLTFILILLLGCNGVTQLPDDPMDTPPTLTPEATEPPEPQPGSSGLGDSLYPQFGNGGYDVQSYTLDITVNDVATSDLDAVATIEAVATQNLGSFNLDFLGFKITRLTVDDETARYVRTGQELTVTPKDPLANGAAFTIKVEYSGIPDLMESQALPFPTGWVVYDGGIYVLSEPDGSASFYPVNDHPLDKATYTFIVTVPKPFEVAANGLLVETTSQRDHSTYRFELRDPMASYLATININDFDIETMQSESGIPIRNYYAASLPDDVNEPFARQGEMLDYYSEIFGPYPFEVYGALVMDTTFGAALENQTLSIFGLDMVDLDDVEGTELVVAHELTHQWFGDSLSLADWGDIWLNEGFATYGEGLWIEHTQGRAALDDWATFLYHEVRDFPEFYPPPGNPPANHLFNGGVYVRGGLTLHALRLEVGDTAFFEILRTYYEMYQGGNALTEDFIQVAAEVSGMELDGFFEGWLYDEALPPIPELGLE